MAGPPQAMRLSPNRVALNAQAVSPNPNPIFAGSEEAAYIYTWTVISSPDANARPSFAMNRTYASQSTSATLYTAGHYVFRVTVSANDYPPVFKDVSYDIVAEATQVVVTPSRTWATEGELSDDALTAKVKDQFGRDLFPQPAIQWTSDGNVGSFVLDSNGKRRFRAPMSDGPIAIYASVPTSNLFGEATVIVAPDDDTSHNPVINDVTVTAISNRVFRLQVDATDDDGVAGLIYNWQVVSKPAGAADPIFNLNDKHEASDILVTTGTGLLNYVFRLTVRDGTGHRATETVTISDAQTLTKIVVSPTAGSPRALKPGATMNLNAAFLDQINRPMEGTLPALNWQVIDEATGLPVTGAIQVGAGGSVSVTAPINAASILVKASTAAGLTGELRILVATDQPAVLKIGGLANNSDSAKPFLIDKATDVQILADDINDEDPISWRLWLVDSTGKRTKFAGGEKRVGQLPVTYASVVLLRPEQLSDGLYTLQLTATNTSPVLDERSLEIHSQYKIGGLRLPFLDAQIDVPGGDPLTATRIYDSLTANKDSDFGYGWSLEMNVKPDQFRTTAYAGPKTDNSEYPYTDVPAFRTGDLVYLTTPDGQEHPFAFVPKKNGTGNIGITYEPQFVAVDGSRAELIVETH